MTVSGTFTAAGQVSAGIDATNGALIAVSGSFAGTVEVQVSIDAGTSWHVAGTLDAKGIWPLFGDGVPQTTRLVCHTLSAGTVGYQVAV